MATIEEVERLVAPAVSDAGFELVDVELIPSPRVLRVSVDSPGGVDLDLLGALAKTISHLLDEVDPLPGGHYDLEVSSPGVERPLRRPEHFVKALGQQVRVRARPGVDGSRRAEGLLTGVDELGIRITGEDGERRIAYDDIERARTVFDWQAALAADRARPADRPRRQRAGAPADHPPTDRTTDTERAATP